MATAASDAVHRARELIQWDWAALDAAKERMRRFALGQPLDRMFLNFSPAGMPTLPSKDVVATDDERALLGHLAQMKHILCNFPEGDYIPFFPMTDFGQAIVPSLFGAEVIVEEKQAPYNTQRMIRDLKADLDRIPDHVDPATSGWGPRLRKRIRFFLEATEGRIPVGVADHQSPYGVATKLISNEGLMLAMYDTPDLVHRLMQKVTNAITDLVRAIQRWAGDPKLVVMNPRRPIPDTGLVIWDDYISVISPELHREFCLPYNMQLYLEFGFGHLHTCGPYFPHYLDSLLAHKGVRSIDIPTYLGATSRTREEMLLLRGRATACGISLAGALNAWLIVNGPVPATPPDESFVRAMADGGLIWNAGGSREQGLRYLSWLRNGRA